MISTRLGLTIAVLIAGAALVLGASIPKAKAAGLGCHVGVQGGMVASNNQTTAAINGFQVVDVNGFGSTGSALGLGAGCDFIVDKIVLGVFGDYTWHNANFAATVTGFGPALALNMELDRQWTIGGRTGVMLSDSTLVYVLAGWTQLSTSGLVGAVSTTDLKDFSGITLGGGIETALGKHVKLGLEYRHTTFDSQVANLTVTGGLPPGVTATTTMRPEMDMAMVRLTYGLDFFTNPAVMK